MTGRTIRRMLSMTLVLMFPFIIVLLTASFRFSGSGTLNRENYKVIRHSDISVYDPHVVRKQFIPLPEKKGAFVRLKNISSEPVMEMVAGSGTYTLSFYLAGSEIVNMALTVDGSNRAVLDVPDDVRRLGYDGLAMVPLSGRNHYIAYIGLLENHEQAVVNKEIPSKKFTAYRYNRDNPDPNASQHDITGVIGYFADDDGEAIHLQAQSISELDVELLAIVTNTGKKIASFPGRTIVETVRTSPRYLVPVKD
jgi:hypothetical protein